jgi:hypothetical protein
MREAVNAGIISVSPPEEGGLTFGANYRRCDAFTGDELKKIFPFDSIELEKIGKIQNMRRLARSLRERYSTG